jgi:hypothetical protein
MPPPARSRDKAKSWNQQVIVENKPGGNTLLAAEYVAKAAPDGHPLLLGPDVTFTVNPHLYRKLSYDPIKDFEPITGLTVLHQALVAHPSLAADSVPGLLAFAKAKPGALNYGTFGLGSAGHLLRPDFSPVALQLLTHHHGIGGPHTLAEFSLGDTDRHGIVRRDDNPRVDLLDSGFGGPCGTCWIYVLRRSAPRHPKADNERASCNSGGGHKVTARQVRLTEIVVDHYRSLPPPDILEAASRIALRTRW